MGAVVGSGAAAGMVDEIFSFMVGRIENSFRELLDTGVYRLQQVGVLCLCVKGEGGLSADFAECHQQQPPSSRPHAVCLKVETECQVPPRLGCNVVSLGWGSSFACDRAP